MHIHELLYCSLTETLSCLWGLDEVNNYVSDDTGLVNPKEVRESMYKTGIYSNNAESFQDLVLIILIFQLVVRLMLLSL